MYSFKSNDFTDVNDCFQNTHNEEIGNNRLARNKAFAPLQPFRSIKYTSSMSVPCIRRISDLLSEA